MDLKIKSTLKRAMSNRVLQVAKCSQKKTSIIKSNDLNTDLSNNNQVFSHLLPNSLELCNSPNLNSSKVILEHIKTVGK
jgi:hypothetical protein